MKAIIIDDEEGARSALSALLRDYVPQVELVAQCRNVPDGVLAINKHAPDCIFLDIEMPEYNGFELLDFFKELSFEIIFVTAYSQYAIKAFEVSAVDYLLKPIEIESLQNAVGKVQQKRQQNQLLQQLELLKNAYHGEEIQKIALPLSDNLLFVDVNELFFFEADRAYSHAYLTNGSKITVSKPLRVFEDILANRRGIFKAHRSYLINIKYIKKYLRGESLIVMENGTQVPLARERKAAFLQLLKDLQLSI